MDSMTPIPDPSPARRHVATSRLRAITAGLAVAGIAGTTGFGLLAANGYTGRSAASSATTPDPSAAPFPGFDDGDLGRSFFQDQGQVGNTVLPPTTGFGPGHATTGGT